MYIDLSTEDSVQVSGFTFRSRYTTDGFVSLIISFMKL